MSCKHKRPFDAPCSCEESRFLLDAMNTAWHQMANDTERADATLNAALRAHHARIIEYFNEVNGRVES